MYYMIMQHDGDPESSAYDYCVMDNKQHAEDICNALNKKAEADFDLSQLTNHLGDSGNPINYYIQDIDSPILMMEYVYNDEGTIDIEYKKQIVSGNFDKLTDAYKWALEHRIFLTSAES